MSGYTLFQEAVKGEMLKRQEEMLKRQEAERALVAAKREIERLRELVELLQRDRVFLASRFVDK